MRISLLLVLCLLAAGCMPAGLFTDPKPPTDEEVIRHCAAYYKACGKLTTSSDMECLKSAGWQFAQTSFQPESIPRTPRISRMLAEYDNFKALFQAGDELWQFSTPLETWDAMAGVSGLMIIREGNIKAVLIGMMDLRPGLFK